MSIRHRYAKHSKAARLSCPDIAVAICHTVDVLLKSDAGFNLDVTSASPELVNARLIESDC